MIRSGGPVTEGSDTPRAPLPRFGILLGVMPVRWWHGAPPWTAPPTPSRLPPPERASDEPPPGSPSRAPSRAARGSTSMEKFPAR
jgi:hypothetical protein